MASEEQRRAFVEYMGSTASAANSSAQQAQRQSQQPQQQQPGPQNPGWYSGLQNAVALQGQGLQNPYTGQQYPGYNSV
jgi:hypothetical protein